MTQGPVAIIPARGGSKRLPRKNIQPLLGHPLLEWPVKTALDSGIFARVIVSTDDLEVAEVATRAGAEVLWRSDGLGSDSATVVEVCLDVLGRLDQKPWCFCCIYATAALLLSEDVERSWAMMADGSVDGVMGVGEYALSPFQALIRKSHKWALLMPQYEKVQSQNYPDVVCSCGMIYWAQTPIFECQQSFYLPNLEVYRIPRLRQCDMNTYEDLQFAELQARFVLQE
mgnify:CR=1 FL=1